MPWFLSDSLPEYSATVDGLLSRRPAEHTILLGAIETLRAAGSAAFGAIAPLFGWWQGPDGEVSAAFLHTPPFPVTLTAVPAPAAAALAQALATRGHTVGGVNTDSGRRGSVRPRVARADRRRHRVAHAEPAVPAR